MKRSQNKKTTATQHKRLPVAAPAKSVEQKAKKSKSGRSKQFSKPAEQHREPYQPKFVASRRLKEDCSLILENLPDDDHALLDSGNGLKLERYGPRVIVRPEAQAIWQPQLPKQAWDSAEAIFTGDTSEEGTGRWAFPHGQLSETWPLQWRGLDYVGRFTSFRHVGVFPEQAVHWQFLEEQIERFPGETKVLNLFGYTGLASLVAARAGAHVTHIDASKKAIGWARENQEYADLSDRPIRWICDDAVKFCEREVKRGNRYHGIILDPPHYGRGPKGEVWQLFEDLPNLLDLVRELVQPDKGFVVLTAYAIRASFFAFHEIMQEKFGDLGGRLQSGELVLKTENSDRKLSTSMYSRWLGDG